MKWQLLDIQGAELKSIDLADDVFNVDMNVALLHSTIKAYRANRRQGTHATKTRSLVSGGGKKPFRQKGSGNARQGSTRSPLMEGGAVVHGPQPRDYTQKLNHKVKQQAVKIALSDKVRHNSLFVVDDFKVTGYSTKHILSSLKSLGCDTKTILLSDERKDNLLHHSSRNIHGVAAMSPSELNAENILRHKTIVLTELALQTLVERLKKDK